MTTLTQDRNTLRREGAQMEPPVAANTRIFGGGMVCINTSNLAVPVAVSNTLKCVGVAECQADNRGGAAGDVRVKVRKGVFAFNNSAAGDAIALSDVGATCFMVSDQTVAKTNGTNTRSAAGTVFDVDAEGVWVRFV